MPQAILPGLLAQTSAAVPQANAVLGQAKEAVRALVCKRGRPDDALIEAHQSAAHALSWLAIYAQALSQMQAWAERLDADACFGEIEQLIHQIAFGEYLSQIIGGIAMSQGEIARLQDMGVSADAV